MEEREKVAAPITRELGGVRQQITDTDKRQGEMLSQLKENQHAMIQYLPQLAIESPKPPPALETPKRPTEPKQPRTLDLDKLYDKQFQQTYDLPSSNEFLQMSNQRLEILYDKVTKIHKSVGGKKARRQAMRKEKVLIKI